MEEPIYVFWDIGDNKGNILSNCKIRCCGSLIECNLLCNWACAYVTLTKSMWTAQVVRDDLKLALCVHRLHMENEAQFRQYWLFRNTNSCYKSTIERNRTPAQKIAINCMHVRRRGSLRISWIFWTAAQNISMLSKVLQGPSPWWCSWGFLSWNVTWFVMHFVLMCVTIDLLVHWSHGPGRP